MTSTTGRVQLLPVKIENENVRSVFKESGAITSLSAADGYIIIPADVDLVEKGEMVKVIMF
jgi:molybdopterin molybdotransferase